MIIDNESELLNAGWLLTEEDVKYFTTDAHPKLRLRTFTRELNGGLCLGLTFGYEINEAGKIVKLDVRQVALSWMNSATPLPLHTMQEVNQLIELLSKAEAKSPLQEVYQQITLSTNNPLNP